MSTASWSLRRSWRVFAAYGAFTAWGLLCLVASVLLILGEKAVPAITSSLLLTIGGIVGATIAGHLLGNAIALLRLRLWVLVVIAGAVALGLTLGSAVLGPAGAFLVVGALAAGGGYFGIASRMDIIAAWLPLSYAMGAAVLWMNNHDKVSVWLTGAKFAVWDAVTFAFLSGAVLLFLVYLMTRHALALTLWQAAARPGGEAIGVDVDARSGRGSIGVLLALTGLVLVTTAVVSPFLFRTRAIQAQAAARASTGPSTYIVTTTKGPYVPPPYATHAYGTVASAGTGTYSGTGTYGATYGGTSTSPASMRAPSPPTPPIASLPPPPSPPPPSTPPVGPPPKSCVPGEPGFEISCLTSLKTAGAPAPVASSATSSGAVAASSGSVATSSGAVAASGGAVVSSGVGVSSSGVAASSGAVVSSSSGAVASSNGAGASSSSGAVATSSSSSGAVATSSGAVASPGTEPNWSSDDPYDDIPGPQGMPQPDMVRAATQGVEVAKMGLSVVAWLVAFFGVLLLLLAVFFRPLRRAIVLRHLERPLWRTPPTRRVENLWLRALVALEDAGVTARSNETPQQLAARARQELGAKHGEVPATLEAAALIIERIEYAGRGLDVTEEAKMRTAVLALLGYVSRHVALARKLGQAWATVPRR